MRVVLIFLTLLIGNFVFAGAKNFADKPLLVQELSSEGAVVSTSLGYVTWDESAHSYRSKYFAFAAKNFAGICLNEDLSPCDYSTTVKDLYETGFKNASGRVDFDSSKFPVLPAFPVVLKTNVINATDFSFEATVTQFDQVLKYRVQIIQSTDSNAWKFSKLLKDESQRKDVTEVEEKLKDYALSVVQIDKESDGNNLLHDSAGTGTGFFISADGFMMTNHHVISMYPDCLAKLFCEILFNQVQPDNSRKKFKAMAYMMAYSIENDFAFLKVKIPADIQMRHLPVDTTGSGVDLVTFGYPGDRTNEKHETKLTYSFGKVVGLYGLGLISSAYISGGASGSPVLNVENMSVTGIMSNGTGSDRTGLGDPGIFRPMILIDSIYKLTSYIDGSKQTRIKETVEQAQSAMDSFIQEKSYYGLPWVKNTMINNKSAAVRKTILKNLEKLSVVAGK
jgi:hypothetical protein